MNPALPPPTFVSQEAICLAPEWSRGYLRAGRALTHLERYNEATVALGLGLEIEPGNKAMRNAIEHAEWVRCF
jgi:predicted TPR repeat methyltransferase